MSTTFKPYCYLIGWSSLNKYYYGVQYGTKANPDNLWKRYFTSSKYVKQFREEFGEPDIIQIRKTFTTKEQAIQWEFKIIQRMNIVRSEQWLNRSLAGQKFYNDGFSCIGHKHTEESKQKMSTTKSGENNPMFGRTGELNSLFGTKHTIEHRLKIYNSSIGKTHTLETKHKMSLSSKGKPKTDEHKKKLSKPKSEEHKLKLSIAKQNMSIETKSKMSNSAKNRPTFECPHCNKFFNQLNLNRWHNDNCKLK